MRSDAQIIPILADPRYACSIEAHESTRTCIGKTEARDHDDLIAEKECSSLAHNEVVHKRISILRAMNIPGAKAAVDKEWEKLEKLPAWQVTEVKSKKKNIEKAQKEGRTVHFAKLMDLCHLKNSELEQEFQKYKGRVVLRGDVVKDDSASCAAYTEQCSSASKTTAAQVLDVIAGQLGCAGQPSDAVAATTRVTMEDAATLLKLPKSECPHIWIRLHLCRIDMGETVRERCTSKLMVESTNLGMPVSASSARSIPVRVRGRHPNGREKARIWNLSGQD